MLCKNQIVFSVNFIIIEGIHSFNMNSRELKLYIIQFFDTANYKEVMAV